MYPRLETLLEASPTALDGILARYPGTLNPSPPIDTSPLSSLCKCFVDAGLRELKFNACLALNDGHLLSIPTATRCKITAVSISHCWVPSTQPPLPLPASSSRSAWLSAAWSIRSRLSEKDLALLPGGGCSLGMREYCVSD